MSKELEYIRINNALGWNQNWFADYAMYDGGCAAVTACDLCIYLAKEKGLTSLYPYDASHICKQDYITFSEVMKPYLHPRWSGIDTLDLYLSGLLAYWRDMGTKGLSAEGLSGTAPWQTAAKLIWEQIDEGFPVPYLLLYHKNRNLDDLQWHWFNLAGYEAFDGEFYVKAVTYGDYRWLNLQELWNTGYRQRGGLIRVFQSEHRKDT